MSKKKKRRHCDDDDNASCDDRINEVFAEMRKIQIDTNCPTSTLDLILSRLQPFLKGLENVKDLKMQRVRARQSRFKRCLHGCVDCNDHVFGPNDLDRSCPKCGHDRYDDKVKANEVCWFFPLREQIKILLGIPVYRHLLMYERTHRQVRRSSGGPFMCDIYDAPRWQRVAGPLCDRDGQLSRIVIQGCVDGCPAYGRMQVLSFKPLQYFVGNLAPWLRYRLAFMLIHAMIPAHLKGKSAKKYYDWFGREMTDLYVNGVNGVRVVVYGTTLDTPGRRELLNMQAVSAFYPCPHCLHSWQPGLRGQTYGGYRRFLPIDSPWRRKQFQFLGHLYQYRDEELRPPAILRNDRNVRLMAARGTAARPFLGHKGEHFLATWAGVDWDGSTCDPMHDFKLLCECILKGVVGGRSNEGMYKAWSSKRKDAKHRADCKAYNIFRAFHSSPDSSPPWRLSRDELRICDLRVRSMWWPSYMDPLAHHNHSFWTHSDRIWKACHKAYAVLVIIPTCLIGFVPAVHTSLLMLVSSLRRLDGQVICAYEAKRQRLVPGLTRSNLLFSAV